MATPTTLNIGEPADEMSVDGNNAPNGENSQSGDCETQDERKSEAFNLTEGLLSPRKSQEEIDELMMHGYEMDDIIEEESKGLSSFFPEFLITPSDVLYKIAPGVGSVCYGYFSLACMEPQFNRAFGDVHKLVNNVFWFQAHCGIGLYIYSRRHIRKLPASRAFFYSIFGTVVFNLGSCMVWGLGQALLPRSTALRVAFSLLSSSMLLYAGQDYLQYVDKSCSELD
ncbi:uncharacterized protein LOC106057760 [Biomphalaria glabrata]|uniref:Uncharacterized protein LOC106057760 n=2 Tax=Biomphalaria glabrata TaxID=6526 RepID=A0A9W2ZMU4_BIOGL|nr:uncharacterized protein LOC106057760 [Biomphalaria glabrata]KAI8765656.1 hypothetical protein BgiMline_003326 [Biomphalaria glabrata]